MEISSDGYKETKTYDVTTNSDNEEGLCDLTETIVKETPQGERDTQTVHNWKACSYVPPCYRASKMFS